MAIYENHEIIHTESHKLNNEAIVYQAELFGIFRANCWIENLNNPVKKFAVFVDNISSLKILQQKISSSKTVQVIWDSTAKANKFDVTYYWIKGHNNNEGNEKADELAKEGTTKTDVIDLPFTKSAIEEKIKNFKETKWQKEWNECLTNKRCKTFINRMKINKAYRKNLLRQSKYYIKKSVEWGTGSCKLNHNLFKMQLTDNPTCRFCNESEETSEHILLKCIRTENFRINYCNLMQDKSIIIMNNMDWKWNKSEVTMEKCEYIDFIYNEIKHDLLLDNG